MFKKLYRVLENMDDSKYLPPRFSYAYKGLADFLGFSDLDDNLSSASEISMVSSQVLNLLTFSLVFFFWVAAGDAQDSQDPGELSAA